MIIKKRDDRTDAIKLLTKLSELPNLTSTHSADINKELGMFLKGEKGEKNSAYYLDFYFGEARPNWAIIHDLRLEINGRVAQIDHLLISRFLEFYILETKNYSNGIKINEQGEFSAFYPDNVYGILSPIEQNERHITVLKDLFKCSSILPTRLGMALKPRYINYVLLSPKSIIERPDEKAFNTDSVIKADVFTKTIDDEFKKLTPRLSDFTDVAKVVSQETLYSLAKDIVSYHKPQKTDYIKKFGIKKSEAIARTGYTQSHDITKATSSESFCASCKKQMTQKQYDFCVNNKQRFKGNLYCFVCQNDFKG